LPEDEIERSWWPCAPVHAYAAPQGAFAQTERGEASAGIPAVAEKAGARVMVETVDSKIIKEMFIC